MKNRQAGNSLFKFTISTYFPTFMNRNNNFKFANVFALLLLVTSTSCLLHAQNDVKAASKKSPDELQAMKKPMARLHLTNGDSLSGIPESIDEVENLLFHSDSLRQIAKFPITKVLSIHMDSWKGRPSEEIITRVELQPRFREITGDTLVGRLHQLTPETVMLDTWYGGIISLKRSMVQSLEVINSSPGNYHGPHRLAEWSTPKGGDSWLFRNGKFISQSTSSIGKDVKLREKSQVSFTAEWPSSMRFKLRLYSNDVTSGSPDAYYEININRSYAYLQTRGQVANGGGRLFAGARWRQIKVNTDNKRAKFDFFTDRKAGIINLFINGKQVCTLQSKSPDPKNLGTGIEFIAENKYPVEISNIIVTPWNGTHLPTEKVMEIESPDQKTANKEAQPHKIILSNGDEVPGSVGKVKDGHITVKTEFTPIDIPIKRIKSISLGNIREEPKKYRGDIRAWLHEGGFITLRLDSLRNGKINGLNQAMGDVSLDLSAFNRIDFSIYNPKANELRDKLR